MNETPSPSERPDPAFDRLRASDPAAGAEPDLTALDAAVRARLAEPADELAVARARRGRGTWLAVAAVTAGVLVVGSTGYALGNSGDSPAANTAGAVITLGRQAAEGPGTGGGSVAPEEMSAADGKVSSSMAGPWYGGYGGRTVFTASGLSDDTGSAQAWAYDPVAAFSADAANRFARALGLEGEASLVDGAWTVGPNDGSGPSFWLQPDGLASVNYYDPGLDPYACQPVEPQSMDGSGLVGSGDAESSAGAAGPVGAVGEAEAMPLPEPRLDCTTTAIGDAPQGEAAIAKARDLMASVGLDAAAFEYEAQESGLPQSSYVNAFQVVAGERTGAMWSIGLVGDGVQSLNGSLALMVDLGTYDVVSANTAVERLTDPRFGASYGGPIMYAAMKGAVTDDPAATQDLGATSVSPEIAPAPARTVPPTPRPGDAFAWPVTEVTLTSARLGLTMHTSPDGATVLLPAYELSDADGQVWSVIAVADSHLNFAPAG